MTTPRCATNIKSDFYFVFHLNLRLTYPRVWDWPAASRGLCKPFGWGQLVFIGTLVLVNMCCYHIIIIITISYRVSQKTHFLNCRFAKPGLWVCGLSPPVKRLDCHEHWKHQKVLQALDFAIYLLSTGLSTAIRGYWKLAIGNLFSCLFASTFATRPYQALTLKQQDR